MEELEKITYPKPEKELLWATYDIFAKEHPWVLGHSIAPKSIVRDMYELGLSFNAYVKEYGLGRAEGVLLRYLSEAYRTVMQTVPEAAKTEELVDILEWLGGELHSTDASLLEEWQKLSDPNAVVEQLTKDDEPEIEDITRDVRAFTVLLRNLTWRIVQALGRRNYEGAAEQIRAAAGRDVGFSASVLEEHMAPYFEEYEELRTDPQARSPKYMQIDKEDSWKLRQTLVDPEEDLGWALNFDVDIDASREAGRPVVGLREIESA